MSAITSIVIIFLSFYVINRLIKGYLVKSLDNISDWLKLSPSVEGATLLSLATNIPELTIILIAFFLPSNYQTIGVGVMVGSVLFDTLLVIGFAGFINKIKLDWKAILRDGAFFLISILLFGFAIKDGILMLTESFLFIVLYLFYLIVLFLWGEREEEEQEPDELDIIDEEKEERGFSKFRTAVRIITRPINYFLESLPDVKKNKNLTVPVLVISFVLIFVCSFLLVTSTFNLAEALKIPVVIVALTILSAGSSMPELIASALTNKVGYGSMAIENVIRGNIFNILVSFGLSSLIWTFFNGDLGKIEDPIVQTTNYLLIGLIFVLIFLLGIRHFKINKIVGIILIFVYIFYVYAIYSGLIEQITSWTYIQNLIL